MNVPDDEADQYEALVYVSAVETDVQVAAAVLAFDPPPLVAAKELICWRVELPAMLLVPAAPGAPTCSWT
jgi:hypothetical protein